MKESSIQLWGLFKDTFCPPEDPVEGLDDEGSPTDRSTGRVHEKDQKGGIAVTGGQGDDDGQCQTPTGQDKKK